VKIIAQKNIPLWAFLSSFADWILCHAIGEIVHARVKEKVIRRFFFMSKKKFK